MKNPEVSSPGLGQGVLEGNAEWHVICNFFPSLHYSNTSAVSWNLFERAPLVKKPESYDMKKRSQTIFPGNFLAFFVIPAAV